MKLSHLVFSILVSIGTLTAHAQELNCNVQVNSTQLAINDPTIFDNMQRAIFEFMNNRPFTEDVYKLDEKIDCSILINLESSVSSNRYSGSIQIQAKRPVYGASYTTTIFSHKDNDLQFSFTPFEPLEFSENAFLGNLTAVLAFYAYVVIGYSYDSFAPNGGTQAFQKALTIINLATSTVEPGWKAFESQFNRYWLIENHLNSRFKGVRTCLYKYHREGLDQMADKVGPARIKIIEAIEELQPVHRNFPNSLNVKTIFNAKMEEIINIFSAAPSEEKDRIMKILQEVDPGNNNRYTRITDSR
jgi:hypothetical protein